MRWFLPSGARVELDLRGAPIAEPLADAGPLFDEAKRALSRVAPALDVAKLSLADFHALRAILTRLGWIAEDEIEITCRNCGEVLRCRPCAGLALGPFEDGELHDPELDATLPFGEPRPIPRVRLAGGRTAETVTFAPRTVGEAAPLHEALGRRRFVITPSVVRAMGVAALGDETRPDRVARALDTATDPAWDAITDAFLDSHYPPRLFAVVPCGACGARNDVDAPQDREFDRASNAGLSRNRDESNAQSFPSLDAFAAAARRHADRFFAQHRVAGVALVVDGDVPACDDGGEPLLGSYVPGDPGGPASPSRQPEITLFYRTFRAMWDEDGPYDWDAEVEETLSHELAHHLAFLAGDDPVDDEERREIAREAARVHGEKALARGAVAALAGDVRAFIARTWPIWLLLALATLVAVLSEVR